MWLKMIGECIQRSPTLLHFAGTDSRGLATLVDRIQQSRIKHSEDLELVAQKIQQIACIEVCSPNQYVMLL